MTNKSRNTRVKMLKEQELIRFLRENGVMKYKSGDLEISFYPPETSMHNDPNEKIAIERNLLPSENFERQWEQIGRMDLTP